MDDGDVGVGQGGARVEGGEGGVVPLGDLAEEDLREDRAGQPQRPVPWIRCRRPRRRRGRPGPEGRAAGAGQVGGAGGDVGGPEVDLPGGEPGNAGAAALRGVADREPGGPAGRRGSR